MFTKSETVKHCESCSKPIRGRTDKKFCDDYCRNHYNNQLKSANNQAIRHINSILGKNRRILEKLLPQGEKINKVSRERILLMGYQFRYFTHIYKNKKGAAYYYCYDHGYLPLENEQYLIVKANDREIY